MITGIPNSERMTSEDLEAAEALGEIGDPRAVDALNDAFNDVDWIVRQAAAEALEKIRAVHLLRR